MRGAKSSSWPNAPFGGVSSEPLATVAAAAFGWSNVEVWSISHGAA
jgi:hypothetical protein